MSSAERGTRNGELNALRQATCKHCGKDFEFEWRGRRRWVCPKCYDENQHKSRKRCFAERMDRWRLKPGEAHAGRESAILSLALRTEQEVADLMGLTQQRVHQIERDALLRLRRLLKEPVRIYREPEPGLDFSYQEVCVDLRSWKGALVVMQEEMRKEGGEGGRGATRPTFATGEEGGRGATRPTCEEENLAELVLEMEREIAEFERMLEAAVGGQRRGRKQHTT